MFLKPNMTSMAHVALCTAANSNIARSILRPAALSRRAAQTSLLVRCNATSNEDGSRPEEKPSTSSSDAFRGFGSPPDGAKKKMTTGEALRESLSSVSNANGRVANRTNVVFTDDSEEKWRQLDSQVNEYPGQQYFKAIGVGGDDFVQAMTACVEEVVGKVHEECVAARPSSKGKYISVTLGPVWVQTPDDVLQIYNKMKQDGRLRYFI